MLCLLLELLIITTVMTASADGMKTSEAGIELIKSFESCRLTAYNPTGKEKMYTIGWGHYGVEPGTMISQEEADQLLKQDLAKFEKAVNDLGLILNQNQFDALVSFAYNTGAGNLRKLCRGRSLQQIAEKMTEYNKAGGKVLKGLTRRRNAEKALFLSKESAPAGNDQRSSGSKKNLSAVAREIIAGKWGNGGERRRRLHAAGYSDAEIREIQHIVNRLMKNQKRKN